MEDSHLFGAMQIFISVTDSGSFSECARRLGISQPSVSRQINALEDYLGVRLLQRTTRRISLTEAGIVYYEKARQIQHSVNEASQSISGFSETPSGVLRVSAPFTWSEVVIAPHIGDFLEQYPDIKLNIECNDQFQDIIEDQLDLVIRVGVLKDSSFIAIPFGQISVALVASPEYLKRFGYPKTPSDIQNHNCILFEDYDELFFTDERNTHSVRLNGSISTNMASIMIAAAKQHMGLTALPDLLIKSALDSGELIQIMPELNLEIKDLPINQIFALYSNRRQLPAKVRAFIDFFKPRISRHLSTPYNKSSDIHLINSRTQE